MRTSPALLLPASPDSVRRAGELIGAGELVAFPTETVYGLGANARDGVAVAKIFAAKRRPRFNPLIVHTASPAEAETLVQFNPSARRLAEAFWPGGLTLVLPRHEASGLSDLVSAGLTTAALRVPAHPVAQDLLRAARVPIAAPSANRSGRVSATTAEAVAEELAGEVAMILDGGPCRVGLESTIIGFEQGEPVLLRAGAVPSEQIEAVVGPLRAAGDGIIAAPGMLASHYAPRAELRLEIRVPRPDEALLAFGPHVPTGAGVVSNLSERGDLNEAAANLFAMLRRLDNTGARRIAVMPIPDRGIGEAINDRLRRAAAPRPVRATSDV